MSDLLCFLVCDWTLPTSHHIAVSLLFSSRREDKASSSTNKSYTRDECVSMDATSIHDQEGLQDHTAIECENESQSSVVEEISIADFAKSIVFRQNTYVQLGNDSIVPTRESNILQKRRQNVRDPDPRPAWGCEWCGLTKYAKRSSDYEQILCPICWSLQKQCRWEMKHYSTSKFFMGPSKKSCRGVKDFLFNSTDIVCKALKSMSHANISVLQGKYTQANKSDKKPHFVKRSISSNLDKKTSGISKSESRLSKSRSGISDFSTKSEVLEGVEGETGGRTVEVPMSIELPAISQLLEEKRGLSGVLQADVLQVYNLHFGTNANIACRILMCLGKGCVVQKSCDLGLWPCYYFYYVSHLCPCLFLQATISFSLIGDSFPTFYRRSANTFTPIRYLSDSFCWSLSCEKNSGRWKRRNQFWGNHSPILCKL